MAYDSRSNVIRPKTVKKHLGSASATREELQRSLPAPRTSTMHRPTDTKRGRGAGLLEEETYLTRVGRGGGAKRAMRYSGAQGRFVLGLPSPNDGCGREYSYVRARVSAGTSYAVPV